MILKTLSDYYKRLLDSPEIDIPELGFEKKGIPFIIVIDKEGNFVNIRDTRTQGDKSKIPRDYLVPQGEIKTSGTKANLFWDSPQWVFGYPKTPQKKDKLRAIEAHREFKKKLADLFPDDFADEGIKALKKFLENIPFETIQSLPCWEEIIEKKSNLSFMLKGETRLICQRQAVLNQLKKFKREKKGDYLVCCVSGRKDIPARLHPPIKGVWGAQSSGGRIVSINLDAFRSFGKEQGLNAPISEDLAFEYTTALNFLLGKESKQRIQVGDTSTVFWAKEATSLEDDLSFLLAEPPKGEQSVSYEKIRSFINSVKTGIPSKEENLPFYVLGLAPNSSRISIRFWYAGTVGELKQRIAQYFQDIDIVRSPREREWLSLFQILKAIAADGNSKNIPPTLGGQLMLSILNGIRYPRTLLSLAVIRCKATQYVSRSRAAIIKAVLQRDKYFLKKNFKEVGMSLDRENDNIGYVLGRLFAVLERVQESAHGGSKLNKTIRDTYFSAACSSPLIIFKRLQDLAIHHFAKIRNSGKSTVWLEKQMGGIMDKIPSDGIPSNLNLEDQGRFAVGYYHQRNDFFHKTSTKENENE
jgi:CRISPR-associated protein Csd1